MTRAYAALFFLAATGLGLSVVVHLAALVGLAESIARPAWALNLGVVVLGLPMTLILNRLTLEFKQKDAWQAALRGCPRWVKPLTAGLFGYAVINALWSLVSGASEAASAPGSSADLRLTSSAVMAFYAIEAAVPYSAMRLAEHDLVKRCVQGHVIGTLARFCEECGGPAAGVQESN